MKIIGLEEHCWTPEIAAALAALPPAERDRNIDVFGTPDVLRRLRLKSS